MQAPGAAELFSTLENHVSSNDYNYEHYRTKHLIKDVWMTLTDSGVHPGVLAPDFTLVEAGGEHMRLSDLRGKPVLLHFGSYT
jgi:cytochrome oxidase Cu insertion factor (SCO1/SenC/PrrC family)